MMKANEMTNGELASRIGTEAARDEVMFGDTKGRELFAEICAEAAARLRALSTLTTRTDNSEVIAELQRRLKAAEDAAVAMTRYRSIGGEFVRYCGRQILAAIREPVTDCNQLEGGAI